jgi:hypothetical protein
MDANELKEITKLLEQGDQIKIATKSCLRPETVSKFFLGGHVAEETELSILNAFSEVIEDRIARKKATSDKIDNLLKK